jgi:hypothetical protein
VTQTTLFIESILNVGTNSGLSTVGLGRVKSVDTGDARCHRLSGPAPNDRSLLRGRGNFLRYLGENPSFQADGLGPHQPQATVSGAEGPLKVKPASATRANTPRQRQAIQRAAIHQGTTRMDKSIRPLPRKERPTTNATPTPKKLSSETSSGFKMRGTTAKLTAGVTPSSAI